jgi:diphthine methyl ester acylhydrolase
MFRRMDNISSSVNVVDTILNADCVAWCPKPAKSHLLLCSTYQLVGQRRSGSLLLFSTDPQLQLLQSIVNLHGVFDFKWNFIGGDIMVAVADSAGQVILLKLDPSKDKLEFVNKTKASDSMALYVDWIDTKLAVSFSNGEVSIFDLDSRKLNCIQTMQNHTLEAWSAVFDLNDKNILYSGGDDCLLVKYDLRAQSSASKNRYHTAGVTHFTTSMHQPGQFMSGSYDELICKWDSRQTRRPLHELGLGGGVWRIQTENTTNPMPCIATACMFKGFKILRYDNHKGFEEIGGFRTDEGCLAYGLGLSLDNKLAMCTFYDHTLQVSKDSQFL